MTHDKAESSGRASVSAGQIWFSSLVERSKQVEALLPDDLSGAVQFVIRGAEGSVELFHLTVEGGTVRSGPGGLDTPETVVMTTEADARGLIGDGPIAPGAVKVAGNSAFFVDYLTRLQGHAPSQSWLEVRKS